MTNDEPIELFFSYSHKDQKMRDRLDAHLSSLKRENKISGWHDRIIMPGSEWQGQIDSHIEAARIVLLLLSADFFDSDYCYEIECNRALERHNASEACVIPIILRPCDWLNTPLGKLQALPRDGKPVTDWPTQDRAFAEVARGIRRVLEQRNLSQSIEASGSNRNSTKPREIIAEQLDRANNVVVSDATSEKLERMRFINAVLKTDEICEDELLDEYHKLLEEMVPTFMPIIDKLRRAGLLTLNINVEDIENIQQYSSIFGEPTFVFDNGNIWIDAEHSGGGLRQNTSQGNDDAKKA